jgi:hypothetical protein
MRRQVRPPSTVRITEVHGAARHGAVPTTQPLFTPMNVTDCG